MGPSAHLEVLKKLDEISDATYSWDKFVATFGWESLNLHDIDTFPGANELHLFCVQGISGQAYEIIGYTHEHVIIVCAIACRGRNHLFPVDTTL